MIFNYNKASLEKVLKNIEPIIPTKSVKPISECILLELTGNILTITATDLSFTNQSVIEVVGIEDGFAIVDGKRFITIVRSFPQGNIKFTKDSNSVVVLSLSRIKQTISSLENKADYPDLPQRLSDNKIIVKGGYLSELIEKCNYACSTDQMRAVLTGVLFSMKGNALNMAATDSSRLVEIRTEIEYTGVDVDVIIPSKALSILQVSVQEDDTVEIYLGDNYIQADLNGATMFARLITGKYPAYKAIIPSTYNSKATINKNALLDALSRMSISSNATTRLIVLTFEGAELEIYAEDSNTYSKGEEYIVADYNGNERFKCGVNVNKITDIIKRVDGDSVIFELSMAGRPVVIKSTEQEKYIQTSIIMPIKMEA
jgi:DNA polymerase-3 subunit beta